MSTPAEPSPPADSTCMAQPIPSHPLGVAYLERGELLRADVFRERMGWSVRTLDRARAAGRVFHVNVLGEPAYPAFFLDPTVNRRRLTAVVKSLAGLPDGAKFLFIVKPRASLAGRTPLDALRHGEFARIKASAQAYAQS